MKKITAQGSKNNNQNRHCSALYMDKKIRIANDVLPDNLFVNRQNSRSRCFCNSF
ncbi:hypothetical protein HMPREF9554_00570 [Treponema phagedenis F0421]|nr:hypothetical protein HMPREF9554_00570 [Treponema phagedenis F0421]